jgi:predicted chitinase
MFSKLLLRLFNPRAIVFLMISFSAHAQVFPVQVTPQLIPPYSVYLSDYATAGNEKLRVIVLQRDLSRPAYQIRLVMVVEWNNRVIMRTSRVFNPPPLNLDPGIPMIISGAELAPYLDSRNIDFVGYDRGQYERTKALPEGQYRISFTAYDYRRQDVQVSPEGNSFYYLAKNEPPLINYPACGTKIAMKTPQQIVFSWMPRNTASPNSALDTEYEFSLYETRPAGRNPNDVVLTSQPVFRTRTNQTQLIYGPAEPMLLQNMNYVWRVQALDRDGRDAFRNNGYSEVCSFYYSAADMNFEIGTIRDLQAKGETKNRAKIWWTPGAYDSYRIEYKKTGQGYEWFKSDSQNGEVKVFDLAPDTEYEARIQAKKSGYFGPYSDIVKFRTLPNRPAQCGENGNLPDRNNPGNPLTSVVTGMVVNARGVEMTLLQVTPLEIPGWYKGIGQVSLDYFLGLSYGVTFDRIFINENRDVIFGRVDVVSEGTEALIQQQIEANKNKTVTTTSNDPQWQQTEFYEKVFQYDVKIESVSIGDEGQIIITNNSGKTINNTDIAAILVDAPEKAIIIEDKNGDQWVVQKDQATGETKVTKVEGGGLVAGSSGHITTNIHLGKLDSMIMVSLRKYKKAIEDYQTSIKQAPSKSKGGGPSLFEWELDMFLSELPSCLEEHKERLSDISANVNALVDSANSLFEVFSSKIAERILDQSSATQDEVDMKVCEALTEDLSENVANGLTVMINGDTLKTTNQVFIVTDQSFKLDAKYNVTNGGSVQFKLVIKPEGGGTDIKHPSSNWQTVQNDESWVLELNSVQEGLYTLSYKVGTTTTNLDFYIRTAAHDYACGVCGRNLKVTLTDLNSMFPNSKIIRDDPNTVDYFNDALKKGGFTTCYRQAHFFSQIFVESRGMNASVEGSNYSVTRILEVHRKKASTKDVFFKQSFWDTKDYLNYASVSLYETSADTTITKYEGNALTTYKWNSTTTTDTVRIPTLFSKKKPGDYKKVELTKDQIEANGKKLLNLVYSNLNGNGNVESGDGYTFRGRGAIQLTGRETYREVAKKCNDVFGTSYFWETDFSPLESDNKAIIYSVTGFFLWKFKDLSKLDTKDVTFVTKKVNGGEEGLDTRKTKFGLYLKDRLNNCKIKK